MNNLVEYQFLIKRFEVRKIVSQKTLTVINICYIYLLHQLIVGGSIYLSKVLYARTGISKSFWQIFNCLTNWDGQWYLSIATNGYNTKSAAFFPLFPVLIHSFNYIGLNKTIAALLISNLALLGLAFVFYYLMRLDYSGETSLSAIWYLLLFPTSLFFSASYTEPLFLLSTVAAFYNARKERWFLAGLSGMLAALTRNWGVFLIIPLACEYLSRINFNFHRVNLKVIWLLLIPIGLAGYMLYLNFNLGDPLAFVHAQSHWKRSFTYPWQAFFIAFQNIRHDFYFGANLLDLVFSVIGLGLILLGIRKIRISYQIFAIIGFLIPLWAAAPWAGLLSMPRFILVQFPIFITMAIIIRNQEIKTGVLSICAGLLAYFSVLFAQIRWIA